MEKQMDKDNGFISGDAIGVGLRDIGPGSENIDDSADFFGIDKSSGTGAV